MSGFVSVKKRWNPSYSFYGLKQKVLLTRIYTRRKASYSPEMVEIKKYTTHNLQEAKLGDASMRVGSWTDEKLIGSTKKICLTWNFESF